MRPSGVEGTTVALDVKLSVEQREEPVLIQALVPKLPVEALDVRVLDGLTRLDELQRDAGISGPHIEGIAAEFGAIVERQARRPPVRRDDGLQRGDDRRAREAVRHGDGEALAGAAIDQGQARKRRPSLSWSLTKLRLQVLFGPRAAGRGTRGTARRSRSRHRTASPPSR